EEHLTRAKLAEDLGYKYCFFTEHQNSPDGVNTSANIYLAALARETSTLRFGPLVYQLPLHHPLRLAQDAAMVDNMSHGRLEFGIGYGINEAQFLRWCVDFHQRREMGLEAMEIILKAWTQDSVTYQGEYWSCEEAFARPKPFQQPYPPIWVGAHSTTSMDYAAANNFHVAQNIDTDDAMAEKFDYF